MKGVWPQCAKARTLHPGEHLTELPNFDLILTFFMVEKLGLILTSLKEKGES